MHEAVVASGQNGAEPDGADPAQTEPIPVAVSGKMWFNQRRQFHPLHLFEQQRNVVDALGDDVGYLIHTQSLTQSAIYLQIWANRKIVEQDHRGVKRVTRPMLGFKSFAAAQDTLIGIELMYMIKKRQLVIEEGDEGLTAAELFYSLAA